VSHEASPAKPGAQRAGGERSSSGWIDSHCHVTADAFTGDRAAVLDRASAAGVERMIAIGAGYGVAHNALAVALAAEDARVYAAVGCHPHDAEHLDDAGRKDVRRWLEAERVVAVGECGLDYWYEHSPRAVQREVFAWHVALAREVDLPVVIHVRDRTADAYEELIDIWKAEGRGSVEGVLHCYTHDLAFAHRALDQGLWVSFSGILTFKRDRGLRATAAALPLERLLVETDAPLLAPEGQRGKRNEPARVAEVGAVLATAQGRPVDEVAAVTARNARTLFRLPG
jgi:TatD DNase family protein